MNQSSPLRSGTSSFLSTHQHRHLTFERPTCLKQGGSRLYVNQKLYNEVNTLFLHYKTDGDICIYQRLPDDAAGARHWCAGVSSANPDYMELSNSGHFQLVNKDNAVYFKSLMGANVGNGFIVLQNDGNFVMYDEFSAVYWACGGGGPFDSIFNNMFYLPPSLCPFAAEIINNNVCRTPPNQSPPSALSHHGTSYMVAKNIPYIVAGVVALAVIALLSYWYNPKRVSSRMVYVTGPDPVMTAATVEMGTAMNTGNEAGHNKQEDN